ncbi:MAG: hypothetical protein VCB42_11860 [Myxococcota bacterium]
MVLVEPRGQDANLFTLNPIAFWNLAEVIRNSFESVRETLHENSNELSDVRVGLG